MSQSPVPDRSVRHYFVDEAGDPTLFKRGGRSTVGTEGCSKFFVLGLLDAPDPQSLSRDLEELRARLLRDPYFQQVPSMKKDAGKTARSFHAKDDLPEVRREVFRLLMGHDLRFFAVVKDKHKVLGYVRGRSEHDPDYRYNPNELYDLLVRRLFKERLHKDEAYQVCFAKRTAASRTIALQQALETARRRFCTQYSVFTDAPIHVLPTTPSKCPPLQATDYFLWALQRLYERGEDRYVQLLWSSFALVIDVDDTRETQYGVYYTRKRPLTAAALKGRQGI